MALTEHTASANVQLSPEADQLRSLCVGGPHTVIAYCPRLKETAMRSSIRPALVAATAALSLATSGCVASTSAGSTSAECSPNFTPSNSLGAISAQQLGRGFGIQWGIYPKVPAVRYVVDVFVDSRRVDHKDQAYPPHGSVSAGDLRARSVFRLEGQAINARGDRGFFYLTCRTA